MRANKASGINDAQEDPVWRVGGRGRERGKEKFARREAGR
jgi:hypothetical protein